MQPSLADDLSSEEDKALWNNELSRLQKHLSTTGYRDALAQVAEETSQEVFDSVFAESYAKFFSHSKQLSFLKCLCAHYTKAKNYSRVQELQQSIRQLEEGECGSLNRGN